MSETIETPVIDKSTWGPGAWQDEPDRVDFVHAGFACMALRRDTMGNWCGYVGVPREHPAYGKDYNDVDVEVHGGLTYANHCQAPICHVPEPGMPDDVFWLGFDCAHAGDLSPAMEARMRAYNIPTLQGREFGAFREVYRDLPYVRAEIESLAEQLRAIAEGRPIVRGNDDA
jgi:hypothetical protein